MLIVKSGTLIIVPGKLLSQWLDELMEHINDPDFSIMEYTGRPQAQTECQYVAASGYAESCKVLNVYVVLACQDFACLTADITGKDNGVLRSIVQMQTWHQCIITI